MGGGRAYVALEQEQDLRLACIDLQDLRVIKSERVDGVGFGIF